MDRTELLYRAITGRRSSPFVSRLLAYAMQRWQLATSAASSERWYAAVERLVRQRELAR